MQTSRKLLLAALDIVGLAVNKGKRQTLPVLGCFRLTSMGRLTTLTATNLDQTAQAHVQSDGAFDTVLPWKQVRTFLAGAKDDMVTFETVTAVPHKDETETEPYEPGAARHVKVVCGGQSLQALDLPVEDMPAVIHLKNAHFFDIPKESLQAALRLTSYAQSTDASRFVLNGVCFEHLVYRRAYEEELSDKEKAFRGDKVTTRTVPERLQSTMMIATDGRRLALSPVVIGCELPDIDLVGIIPTEAVNMLEKLVKRYPANVTVSFQPERREKPEGSKEEVTYPGFIRFHLMDATIDTKLIEGNFPNWRQVIPTDAKLFLDVDRLKFIEAIKGTRMRGHPTDAMSFDFFNHVCTIEQEIRDAGKSTGQANFYGKLGRKFKIGFNGTYIQEALESLISPRVTLNFIDELSPITITSREDGNHKIVIMPVRMS